MWITLENPNSGCHGFGVRDKAVSSVVERRESPIDPRVQIAPHEDIPSKMHGLVADSKTSKTVAPRIDAFL